MKTKILKKPNKLYSRNVNYPQYNTRYDRRRGGGRGALRRAGSGAATSAGGARAAFIYANRFCTQWEVRRWRYVALRLVHFFYISQYIEKDCSWLKHMYITVLKYFTLKWDYNGAGGQRLGVNAIIPGVRLHCSTSAKVSKSPREESVILVH